MTVITTALPEQWELVYADCTKCDNSMVKSDGNRRCLVKNIDCSVRKGQRPCSHFKGKVPVKENKEFRILLTACATQIVTAPDKQTAAKMADWCEADIDDWEVSEIEEV